MRSSFSDIFDDNISLIYWIDDGAVLSTDVEVENIGLEISASRYRD